MSKADIRDLASFIRKQAVIEVTKALGEEFASWPLRGHCRPAKCPTDSRPPPGEELRLKLAAHERPTD